MGCCASSPDGGAAEKDARGKSRGAPPAEGDAAAQPEGETAATTEVIAAAEQAPPAAAAAGPHAVTPDDWDVRSKSSTGSKKSTNTAAKQGQGKAKKSDTASQKSTKSEDRDAVEAAPVEPILPPKEDSVNEQKDEDDDDDESEKTKHQKENAMKRDDDACSSSSSSLTSLKSPASSLFSGDGEGEEEEMTPARALSSFLGAVSPDRRSRRSMSSASGRSTEASDSDNGSTVTAVNDALETIFPTQDLLNDDDDDDVATTESDISDSDLSIGDVSTPTDSSCEEDTLGEQSDAAVKARLERRQKRREEKLRERKAERKKERRAAAKAKSRGESAASQGDSESVASDSAHADPWEVFFPSRKKDRKVQRKQQKARFLFEREEFFNVSLQERNEIEALQDHERQQILQRRQSTATQSRLSAMRALNRTNASLGFGMEESKERDRIVREWRQSSRTLGLQIVSTPWLVDHEQYCLQLYFTQFVPSTQLAVQRLESMRRVALERQHGAERINIIERRNRFVFARREWENEKKRMEDRQRERQADAAGVSAAAAARGAQRRQKERDAWIADRLKLKAVKPLSDWKDPQSEFTAAIATAAAEDADRLIATAKANDVECVLLPHIATDRRLAKHVLPLTSDEQRARSAVELECARRLEIQMDSFFATLNPSALLEMQRCLPESKEAASHVSRLHERLAEAKKKDAEAEEIRNKVKEIEAGLVKEKYLVKQQESKYALIEFDEQKKRRKILATESKSLESCLEAAEEWRQIVATHDRRREQKAAEALAIIEADEKERFSIRLLQDVGRSYLFRRSRLSPVYHNRDEIRPLIGEQVREWKTMKQYELIARIDLVEYFDLQMAMHFGSKHKRLTTASFSPDSVPSVEKFCRERLEGEYAESFQKNMVVVFDAEAAAIARLPPHMIGARQRSALKIQSLWRGVVSRRHFIAVLRDPFVIRRIRRVTGKMDVRFLQDQEAHRRVLVEDEWTELDLFGEFFRRTMNQFETQRLAARKIQSVFRGYYHRRRVLPGLQEGYFKYSLEKLRTRRAVRKYTSGVAHHQK